MEKFSDLALKITKMIPKGKVASYGQIALLAGEPRAARQVGWVLNQKSDEQTPWWRVINNSGRISIKHPEISALEQKELLKKEGVKAGKNFVVDINKYRWHPI
jgi:methylated-DNA-protein-cysteine methyltransferase-like protein